MIHSLIADIRFVSVQGRPAILEVLRCVPVVDASGAICGFQVDGIWEQVGKACFDSPASYYELRSLADIQVAGSSKTVCGVCGSLKNANVECCRSFDHA